MELIQQVAIKIQREARINFVLALEVLIDRTLADLGLLRNLLNRDKFPIVTAEQNQRRVQNLSLATVKFTNTSIFDTHIPHPINTYGQYMTDSHDLSIE